MSLTKVTKACRVDNPSKTTVTYNLAGHSGAMPDAGLAPDLSAKEVGGIRVQLVPPAAIYANQPALFRVRVTQASDGDDVRDLQALLGAGTQVAIIHQNGHHCMHMYAQPGVLRKTGMRDMPAPTLPFGPDLGFTQTFEEAGLYRVWVEVEREAQEISAPFTIEVK